MTQKQLAVQAGVSRQTMNAIENCRHALKIDVAIRITDVFSVCVDELFDFDYEGKPACTPSATMAVRQPAATVARSVENERDLEPVQEEPEGEITFASLAKVIG